MNADGSIWSNSRLGRRLTLAADDDSVAAYRRALEHTSTSPHPRHVRQSHNATRRRSLSVPAKPSDDRRPQGPKWPALGQMLRSSAFGPILDFPVFTNKSAASQLDLHGTGPNMSTANAQSTSKAKRHPPLDGMPSASSKRHPSEHVANHKSTSPDTQAGQAEIVRPVPRTNSLPGPMNPIAPPRGILTKSGKHNKPGNDVKRITQLLDDILLLRTKQIYERNAFMDCHRFLLESFRALGGLTNDDPLTGLTLTPQDRSVLLSNYDRDLRALQAQHTSWTAIQNELSNLEYRLRRKEEKLFDFFRGLPLEYSLAPSLVSRPSLGSSSDSDLSGRQTEMDPLLEEYLERKGDVGIFRERLFELESAHDEGLVERDLLRDRGDLLKISDEQYQEDHEKEKRTIEADLEEAQKACDKLARECIAAGIDINDPRISSSSETRPNRTMSPVSNDRSMPPEPTSDVFVAHRVVLRNVPDWLESLEYGGPIPPEVKTPLTDWSNEHEGALGAFEEDEQEFIVSHRDLQPAEGGLTDSTTDSNSHIPTPSTGPEAEVSQEPSITSRSNGPRDAQLDFRDDADEKLPSSSPNREPVSQAEPEPEVGQLSPDNKPP